MLLNDYIKPTRPGRRKRQTPAYPVFSDEDKDLAELEWYMKPNGYAARTANYKEDGKWKNKTATAHRVVLERKLGRELTSDDLADHFNRNKMDCRRENIVHATHQMNTQNRKIPKNNTSGYKGVVYWKSIQRWVARVKIGKKQHVSKACRTKEEAAAKIIEMRKRLGIHDYELTGQVM